LVKKRSVGEQIKSGFRIGGLVLLSFAVFSGLAIGFDNILGHVGEMRRPHAVLGTLLVSILACFLFMTAQYWARWMFAFLVWGCMRLGVSVLFGAYSTIHPIDRKTAVVWLGYTLTAAALTFRYVKRNPTSLERLGLVTLTSCVALAGASGGIWPLVAGLAVLATCELIQWLVGRGPQLSRRADTRSSHYTRLGD
jgi:hypothetical protein